MITGVKFEGDIDTVIRRGSRTLDGKDIDEKKMDFENRYTTMIPLRRE